VRSEHTASAARQDATDFAIQADPDAVTVVSELQDRRPGERRRGAAARRTQPARVAKTCQTRTNVRPWEGAGTREPAVRRALRVGLLLVQVWCVAQVAPPPKNGLRQLRLSPDGRYVLAQDAHAITLLTVRPLAVLFPIHAEGASAAHFTPDSQQVLFVSSMPANARPTPGILRVRSGPRVERWTITSRTYAQSPEIRGLTCATEELSPDGRTLACDDPSGTLRIIDVASGEVIFEKKDFVKLVQFYSHNWDGSIDAPTGRPVGDLGLAIIDFSPDSRFLIAHPYGGEGKVVAWDIGGRIPVAVPAKLRGIGRSKEVFLPPHYLLLPEPGYKGKHGVVTAELVAFPSREVLTKYKVPVGLLFPAADPDFVLVHRFGRGRGPLLLDPNAGRTAAAELNTGQVIISDTPALDVFGQYYVAEPSPGVVGLYVRGKGLQATVSLYKQDRLWQTEAQRDVK
jgi:hypothetical protein